MAIESRGYSQALQRALVDFGADVSFAAASQKLQEHYGLEVPASSIRAVTLHHAKDLGSLPIQSQEGLPKQAAEVVIVESDGTMVPMVETADSSFEGDRRKTRQVLWKEGITSLAYAQGTVDPLYAGTLEGRDEAGFQMKEVALAAGLDPHSRVHALGDGAPWIYEKMEVHFGTQAHYLIDFYHLCDYLNAADQAAFEDYRPVFSLHQHLLKTGKASQVVAELKPKQEPSSTPKEQAPIRALVRYMENRPGQFEYQQALAQQLPIGSGKIESSHRSLIQKRLKLPGAWWKKPNADKMIQLRAARANGQWEEYWQKLKRA
jgi:hypothetical protein